MAGVLKEASSCAKVFETLLCSSFGPCGMDVALKMESGTILVTNNGYTILSALSVSHPVGRMLIKQAQKHAGITGDGSKTFVIICSNLLSVLSLNIKQSLVSRSATTLLSGMSQAFGILRSNVLKEVVIPELKNVKFDITLSKSSTDEKRKYLRSLCAMGLNGKFSCRVVDLLTTLTTDLLLHLMNDFSLQESIHYALDHFSDICIELNGIGLEKSRLLPGIIIQKEPIKNKHLYFKTGMEKLVIFTFDLESETNECIFLVDSSNKQIPATMVLKYSYYGTIARYLRSNDIDIVLLSSDVPDGFQYHACQFPLTLISNVPEEDIRRICDYYKIIPIGDDSFLFEKSLSLCFIGKVSFAKCFTLGKSVYFQLGNSCNEGLKKMIQLILCSPSPGIGQQYYVAIHNTLKIIRMASLQSYHNKPLLHDPDTLTVMPGAGASEIYLAKLFENFSTKLADSNLKFVSKAFSDALLTIPQLIHSNSLRPSNTKRFIQILSEINSESSEYKTQRSRYISGINAESGQRVDPLKNEIFESYSSKILLMEHILQIMQQITRIETVIGVKSFSVYAHGTNTDDSDVSDE